MMSLGYPGKSKVLTRMDPTKKVVRRSLMHMICVKTEERDKDCGQFLEAEKDKQTKFSFGISRSHEGRPCTFFF